MPKKPEKPETKEPQYISRSIALPLHFIEILEQLADERMGSLASVVRVILRDHLKKEGYDVE